MDPRNRLVCCFLTLAAFASPVLSQVDHPCIPEPVLPDDCVDQLGPIGEPPPVAPLEGYLGIATPIVDPLLRLDASDERDGRLYALNVTGNRVRVFAQDATQVLADVEVCYRPSALAQDTTGDRVFVACHASDAVGIIDTSSNLMIGVVQDRDELGRPLLQEPMGMAFVDGALYVASSRNSRVAVVDPDAESVTAYVEIPGQDPRSIAVTDDGAYLLIANFLAGNRTEAELTAGGSLSPECVALLKDPAAMAVFDEASPSFMDDSHPEYPLIAECYFAFGLRGEYDSIIVNPQRADHDVVVLRLADHQVVFSTNSLGSDAGTLNYGIRASDSRVYLATVHARNGLNGDFGNRPLVNGLTVFDLQANGQLSLTTSDVIDLDAPFLDEAGFGSAKAATPYGITVDGDRVLLTAAGTDRLVVTDLEGGIQATIPVGFGPKGVVAAGDTAWVYNATGLSLSRVDLDTSSSVETAGLGDSPMPQSARIGARLFESAQFSENNTFACASCHPDGHVDGLVWQLAEGDGLRATMSVRQITEEAPYHWDGSKCNLVKILQDGLVNLFGSPEPSDCQMKTMIDYMEGLVHPRTPFRPIDDSLSDDAALGAAIMHRAEFRNMQLDAISCNGRAQDMSVEGKTLAAAGDPYNEVYDFKEDCGSSGCHVAPHLGAGFESEHITPTFLLGLWDRNTIMHDASGIRAKVVEAVEVNRAFFGASTLADDQYTGEVSTLSLLSAGFKHPEFHFDEDPATHAFSVSDLMGRYMLEEQELQSGALGLTVVLREDSGGSLPLLDELESAATQGKVKLVGVGTLGGELVGLTWQSLGQSYQVDGGGSLTRAQLLDVLGSGDAMMLSGKLLFVPSVPHPKLVNLRRIGAPYLCREGYVDYPAAVQIDETDVMIRLTGIDVVAGSRVLVDGQVSGLPLSGSGPLFSWSLPVAPSTPTVLAIQVLAPNGLLSNTQPLPVVEPVVPAAVVGGVVASAGTLRDKRIEWPSQFGLTGPGTHYSVHRGLISDLREGDYDPAICFHEPEPELVDAETPPPGDGFYYVVRADNQLGPSSWGSAQRDAQMSTCPQHFD